MQGGWESEYLMEFDQNRSKDPRFRDMFGTHRGHMVVANVRNPQPNCVYYWSSNDPAELIRHAQYGAQVVKAGDPEYADVAQDLGIPTPLTTGLPTDTTMTIFGGELVLVRYDEEAVKRRRAARHQAIRARAEGAGASFYSDRLPNENNYERPNRPLRYDVEGEHLGYHYEGSDLDPFGVFDDSE